MHDMRDARIESWFSGPDDLEDKVVKAVECAKSSVHVHVYKLRSKPIRNALLDAHRERCLTVEVLLDHHETTTNREQNKIANKMLKKEINLRLESKKRKAHVKVIIIDREKVLTGSYNLISRSRGRDRLDNLIAITDEEVARDFLKVFVQHFPKTQKKHIPYRH